jgi:DNA repair exonuclease SbcCD nuclease subunit
MTVRLFVTADNHLNRFTARLTVTRLEERRRRLRQAFRQVVDAAIAAKAAALILGGDIFDAVDPRNLERAAFARMLKRLREAGVVVVATGGNHDSPRQTTDHGGYGPFSEFEEAGLLHYLDIPTDGATARHVIVESNDQVIAIAGVPWLPAADGDPIFGLKFPEVRHQSAYAQTGRDPDWRVFITHGSIEGHTYPGPLEPVIGRQTIADLEVDLFVAGHVHQSFDVVVPCPSGRHCHVVVPGSTERMTFGEEAVRPGYVVVDLPRHGPLTMTRRLIAPQARVTCEIPSTELTPESLGGLRADAVDATALVVSRLEAVADTDALASLRLYGVAPREVLDDLNLAEVQAFGANRFFSFDLDVAGLVPADTSVAMSVPGVRRTAVEEVRATIDQMAVGASRDELAVLEQAWLRIMPMLGGLSGDDHAVMSRDINFGSEGPEAPVQ